MGMFDIFGSSSDVNRLGQNMSTDSNAGILPQLQGFDNGLGFENFKMPGFAAEEGGFFGSLGDIFKSKGFGQGVSAFSTLANIYGGFKSLGLAEDQFDFQKSAFNKNFEAQKKDYENTLKDRWTARNASASSRDQSFPGMDQWLSNRTIGS